MRYLLPPLHEGHAPIFLHQAFEDAVEAFESWVADAPEPVVDCDGRPTAISAVFGRMRTCTDILPMRVVEDVLAVLHDDDELALDAGQASYAEAARVLRAHCVSRLKA
ncbi:MAG TPA: hypothetical protein VNS34_02965 [Rhizobiaceae bacterium]|nr:hypothetical protein [Rhizobiaceae bacterium]